MMHKRFRGYLPVVIDIETAGFNSKKDALLELAAYTLRFDDRAHLQLHEYFHYHIAPFEGANLEQSALEFTGIDPYHPFRMAISEKEALTDLFKHVRKEIKLARCQRAVLVGHNPAFDISFLQQAIYRCAIKRVPFHPFTTFDTASLAAVALGQTVLAKSLQAANIPYEQSQAHSALYDAKITAELFCYIVNAWNSHHPVIHPT